MKDSLYHQISTEIKFKIGRGDYKAGERLPTFREIMAIYGVSNTTALKVLDELVNAGFAYKIQGSGTYLTDFACRPKNIILHLPRLFGVDFKNRTVNICSAIVDEMETILREHNINLMIYVSHGSRDIEIANIKRIIASDFDAVVMLSNLQGDDKYYYDLLKNTGRPVVFIEENYPTVNLPYVASDNYDVFYNMTKKAISMGKTNFIYLGQKGSMSADNRYNGFADALRGTGIVPEIIFTDHILYSMKFTDPVYSDIVDKISKCDLNKTAVVAVNSVELLSMWDHCQALLKDSSVTFIWIDEIHQKFPKNIIQIFAVQPLAEMVKTAASLIIKKLCGTSFYIPKETTLSCKIRVVEPE